LIEGNQAMGLPLPNYQQTLVAIHPAMLDTNEAARYIGAAETALTASRVSGRLYGAQAPAFVRQGRNYTRYTVVDLDKWIASLVKDAAIRDQGE
jgi:hypothetical protein